MIKREVLDDVISWLDRDKVIVIKGARQVGKTTLLLGLKQLLESENKRVVYIAADEYRDSESFRNPQLFLKFIEFEYGFTNNMYVFIDEFQYIKEAGVFVKTLRDIIKRQKSNINIIVSGSSSLEITKNTEFLTGRKVEFLLSPFSFYEYLSPRKQFSHKFQLSDGFNDMVDFYNIYKKELNQEFASYIRWGGYPEVALEKEKSRKKIILKEIIRTYIERDISGFLNVENISGFNKLVKLLTMQTGSLVNKNELSNTLNLHHKTLSKYLDMLEGTFVFSFVSPFYTNVRKEISKMPKVYVNDTGIYYYFNPIEPLLFDSIAGQIAENYIYNTLKSLRGIDSINFYRTISKSEVDFVIKKESKIIPMEVKFRSKVTIPVPLKHFRKLYEAKESIIITKDEIKREAETYFIPISMFGLIEI